MIETQRLQLRYVTMSDIDDIFEYTSDVYNMRYERSEFKSKEELSKMLEYFVKVKGAFAIMEKSTKKVIGQIVLIPTSPTYFNEYNLGYILHQDFHGKGYCTEASKAVIDYGFNVMKVHRIRAACDPENIGSWRVMEKLNMKKEAHFKKRVCFKNDEWGKSIYTDEYVYAINQEDYTKQ